MSSLEDKEKSRRSSIYRRTIYKFRVRILETWDLKHLIYYLDLIFRLIIDVLKHDKYFS